MFAIDHVRPGSGLLASGEQSIDVVGRLADPSLAANLAYRCPLLSLPQDEGNLRLRELRSLHGPSPSWPESHMPLNWNLPELIGPENREQVTHRRLQ
jgi:hypothetical protein